MLESDIPGQSLPERLLSQDSTSLRRLSDQTVAPEIVQVDSAYKAQIDSVLDNSTVEFATVNLRNAAFNGFARVAGYVKEHLNAQLLSKGTKIFHDDLIDLDMPGVIGPITIFEELRIIYLLNRTQSDHGDVEGLYERNYGKAGRNVVDVTRMLLKVLVSNKTSVVAYKGERAARHNKSDSAIPYAGRVGKASKRAKT